MPRQRARNWAVPEGSLMSSEFPHFAHRVSTGRRSRRTWVLGSERFFATPERVPKFGKGILEHSKDASWSAEEPRHNRAVLVPNFPITRLERSRPRGGRLRVRRTEQWLPKD